MATLNCFDFILFGGNGDLAMRKLLPALYYRHRDTPDTSGWRIIGTGRRAIDRAQYVAKVRENCARFVADKDFDEAAWEGCAQCLDYVRLDANAEADYQALKAKISESSKGDTRVFYLATAPGLFGQIADQLGKAGLVTPQSRVVLEKPLGRDLASANLINEAVGAVFAENQIFRIDHYLGKETVQNLIALRFGNILFEPLWNRSWIHDVQITIAETVGVEGRGEFYDNTGALRDMVQNHLLQLLCIVAMEPPSSIDADNTRDEKLKVLRALRPFTDADIAEKTVRGRYGAGVIKQTPVVGYLEEKGIPASSRTETFVAIKAELDNWRWAGVPFYLRTGKRMQQRMAEIVVNFRHVPHAMFPWHGLGSANQLVITLQPDEGLRLNLMAKVPGEGMQIQPISLDVAFAETYRTRQWDAYERLIMDVIHGKLTLFMRRDELDAAWRWIEPILNGWDRDVSRLRDYPAGSWGPTASSSLVVKGGSVWNEEA